MGNAKQKSHFWRGSSRKVDVSLVGKIPYGISLGGQIWDLGAFRPDPREYLLPDKIYPSEIEMEVVHLYSGRKVRVPREIKTRGKQRFVNMR